MACLCAAPLTHEATGRSSGRFYVVYEGSGTQFKMARLAEDTEYRLRICAANEAGDGPYSNVISTRTTRQPPPSVRGELPTAPRMSGGAHCERSKAVGRKRATSGNSGQ